MTEWEAKYRALLTGVRDPSLINNAEKIVKAAEAISRTGDMPFEKVFWGMVWMVAAQQTIFGPPIKHLLTPEQALVTLRDTLVTLLEQWDNTAEGGHLGSDCLMLADRWVDLVAQRKGWK